MDLSNLLKIPRLTPQQIPKPIKKSPSRHIKLRTSERVVTKLKCLYLAVFGVIVFFLWMVIWKGLKWLLLDSDDDE